MQLATLIGDVVGSRESASRRGLQHAIDAAVAGANETLAPTQPIQTTIGDEFQGAFSRVADAVAASLLIRLELLVGPQRIDSRFGLGWGSAQVFDAKRPIASQDGEAWWSARDGIERAHALQQQARTKFVSACFGASSPTPWARAVDAYLALRDQAVWGMSARQRMLVLQMSRGASLNEAAEHEDISASAAFQSLERSGGFAMLEAARRFANGSAAE